MKKADYEATTCATEVNAMDKSAPWRKPVAVIGWLWLMALVPGWAQSPGETEKELIGLQNQWATARIAGDVAFLENLYARELRITGTNGSVVERDADIGMFASRAMKPEYIRDQDMKVAVYGEAAVVTGVENLKGTYKGVPGEASIRFTNVFVRRDGRWQLVAAQGTEVRGK